ncbi:mitochondrial carrier [Ceraceosorus bombacis]|uniref:Mitochondrial carrier n=1 Tax=Ceraceosorus bombacis TaxID=401625 RepID=A0A0P1BAP2_9BASI|nr:mitochondrial carrier [Ceraceosorus bombacis]
MSSDDSFIHACAGGAGGVIAMTATYPLMSISMRAAVQSSKHPEESMVTAAAKIIQKEGITGLYSGLNSSLIGVGVSNFIYYFFFEKTRDAILVSKQRVVAANTSNPAAAIAAGGALSTLESMLAGFIAGSATTIATNPIWVINTRQTVRTDSEEAKKAPGHVVQKQNGQAPVKKMGFIQTANHVLKTDGLAAFWRGLGPALVLVINPILQYTAFEQLKNWLVKSRLARLPEAQRGLGVTLSDLDFFLLGALSKLFATGLTYPQIVIKSRQQSGGKGSSNVWTAMTEIVQREGIAGLYRGIASKLLQSVATAGILFASKEQVFRSVKLLLAADAKK